MRRLNVALDFGGGTDPIPVGTMAWDRRRRSAALQWSQSFAGRPLPISPLMVKNHAGLLQPKGRAFGGLPGVLGDSLPDGWGLLLIDREIAARGQSLADITDLDRLSMVGRMGMGALTYQPEASTDQDDAVDLSWFERTVPGVEGGATADELERLRRISGGSQGARPKFVALLGPDGARLISHRQAWRAGWRHILVKRRAVTDPSGSVEAELAYAAMAKAAGIDMAWTGLLSSTSGEAYFATERFDRRDATRLHMQTVAGLLEVDFRTATMDYGDLLKVVAHMTRNAQATERMYRRMVFNARAMNRDDHLKNHAFLMDRSGAWSLAPAYDVSFSRGPGGEQTLTVAGEGRRPGATHLAEVARGAGLKPARATQIVDEVDAAISRWGEFAQEAAVPPTLRREIASELRRAADW